MVKRLEERLENNKAYGNRVGRPLTKAEIVRLYDFHARVGYTPDRINTIIQFIVLGYTDWCGVWQELKSLHNGTLEYQKLLYGDKIAETKYKELNRKKTKGFDYSSVIQREKGLKSAKLSKGNKEWSVRGLGYWLKTGCTEEEAKEKVREIQSTNSLERYIKKYGETEGVKKFNERRDNWGKNMSSPFISKKKSLGLWRYVERYGEVEGERKYIEMRIKRNTKCSIGLASKESLVAFSGIVMMLEKHGIKYYLGVAKNKEWHIYNKKYKKMFFYDLTIPSLSVIVEYHGEGFHPNPNWSPEKLTEWKQVRTGKPAEEILNYTKLKNNTATENGWTVFEIFSSDTSTTVPELEKAILELICS